jgi:hypothetical protein
VKKVVIEIPLNAKLKPNELREIAHFFQWTITKTLSTCTHGRERVHVPERIAVRVEEDDEAGPRARAGGMR